MLSVDSEGLTPIMKQVLGNLTLTLNSPTITSTNLEVVASDPVAVADPVQQTA